MSFRSSSLPRHKPTPLDFRFSHNLIGPNKLRRPGSQVRFDQKNTYYSTYDEDSDAGLEDLKAKHLLGECRSAHFAFAFAYEVVLENRLAEAKLIIELINPHAQVDEIMIRQPTRTPSTDSG